MTIHPAAQWSLWLGLCLLVIAVSVRVTKSVVTKWYGDEAEDSPHASDMLTKFGDLHSRGGLSDEEYRTIKTKLASQLQSDMGVSALEPRSEGGDDQQEASLGEELGS